MNWNSIMPRLHMSAAVPYSRWNTSGAMYTASESALQISRHTERSSVQQSMTMSCCAEWIAIQKLHAAQQLADAQKQQKQTWRAGAAAELGAPRVLAAAEVDGLEPAAHGARLDERERVAHALLQQEVGGFHVAVHQPLAMARRHHLEALIQHQRRLPLRQRTMVLRRAKDTGVGAGIYKSSR